MPSPLADTSHGYTITFATSGFTGNIVDITPPNTTLDPVNTSHQGTTGAMTFIPSDLPDNGELSFSVQYNPDITIPVDAAADTVTVTSPEGATDVFPGFFTGYAPTAPHLNLMTADVTLKVAGDITKTPEA